MELKLVLVSAISILGRDDLKQVARILIVIICTLNTVELKRSSQVKFNPGVGKNGYAGVPF